MTAAETLWVACSGTLPFWVAGEVVVLDGCSKIEKALPMKVFSVTMIAANVALAVAVLLLKPQTWGGYVLVVWWVVDLAVAARLMLVRETPVGAGPPAGVGRVGKVEDDESKKEVYEVVSRWEA